MIPSPYPKSTRWLIIAPALFLLVFLAIPTAVLVQRGASADAFLNIISAQVLDELHGSPCGKPC